MKKAISILLEMAFEIFYLNYQIEILPVVCKARKLKTVLFDQGIAIFP